MSTKNLIQQQEMTPTVATCPFCAAPKKASECGYDRTLNDGPVTGVVADPFGTALELCASCGTVYCSTASVIG